MINIKSSTQGAGISSLSNSSENPEKKMLNKKEFTKNITSVNNPPAGTTISSNNSYLTANNIHGEKKRDPEKSHHLARKVIKNIRKSYNPATSGNVPSNRQPTKAEQDSNTARKLQNKQDLFEYHVERFTTCDVKIQELLKFIRSDKELWKEVSEKLEIRVIKVKDEDEEIVLHPKNEQKERWSGKYHVYLTVNNEGEKLVIDPYIGGGKSCAHIDEQDFLKSHWKGREGKEYVLETIAPVNESYSDEGDYTPGFSIHNYMNNLFEPDIFESHKFYYR